LAVGFLVVFIDFVGFMTDIVGFILFISVVGFVTVIVCIRSSTPASVLSRCLIALQKKKISA
jgi:hypothetical protein